MPRRRVARRAKREGPAGARREWVGGRLSPPFFITDRDEPYRPELVIWMEAPSGLVVGQEAFDPDNAEGVVSRVLLAAMKQPLAGPPRRPDAIRVADASLAAEVRAAVGDAIPITVAPTPELDALLELMLETVPEHSEAQSYLEGGRVPPAAVDELFSAAGILYRIAPWKVALDGRVLRMDIPALGVEGACVSIIGNLGESLGVLIFPSLVGFEAFLRAAEGLPPGKGRIDLGTGWLALSFERGADLPESMRREVAIHAWPVAAADAYPRVERRERDGASRPLVERDLKIAAVCATSLSSFFVTHRGLFEADEFEPVCESFFDEDDIEVRFTIPYEALPEFDVDERPPWLPAEPERVKVGRNDPCPCGSGRKYKKCHLSLDEEERSGQGGGDAFHDLDAHLVHELTLYASDRFESEWRRFTRDFADASETLQLAVPWSVFHYRVQGATVLDHFLEKRGRHLSRAERGWLDSQGVSWLSVWEVTRVEPGVSLTLRDLLSEETREVREASGSQTLVVRDALLARVVDHKGVSLICGMHPRALPPIDAAEVVRRARGRLRRKRAVPPERLREEAFGRYLIRRWEEAVAALDARLESPPDLRNTDDHAVLLTTDHFEITPGARGFVETQLGKMEGVEPPIPGEDPPVYVFLRPGNAMHGGWETTAIGQAQLSDTKLRLETNSRERADALRQRVEAACGDRIRHRAREHTDPLSPKARAGSDPEPSPPPTAEMQQLVLDYKERHYADWIDQSLPALNGKTPREAVRSAPGRTAVDILLKEMENHEQRGAKGGTAFDFSAIRRQLRFE